MAFFDIIDRLDETDSPDPLFVQYYRASLQATNDRVSRFRRAEVMRAILSENEQINWTEWSANANNAMVDTMITWFFSHYEDPANSVPFESAEGGYQYSAGGPYEAAEVLSDKYVHVPERLIAQAVERINSSCSEWVKKGQY
jgi:hypothetical protein